MIIVLFSDIVRIGVLYDLLKAFPINSIKEQSFVELPADVVNLSDSFSFKFLKAGYMHNGMVYNANVSEKEEKPIPLL